MSPINLRARNFRRLAHFDWSPGGVCALSGPNGAGKSTTLDMLRFLRAVFVHGIDGGFSAVRGGDHFPSRGASVDELVEFEVTVGEIRWVLRLPMSDAGTKSNYYGEELYRGDTPVLRAAPYAESWYLGSEAIPRGEEARCCAKVLYDRGGSSWMEPLARTLFDIRVYDFWLNVVQEGTSREDRASFLHGHGGNLWAVLANWKQAPLRFRGQFDWVLSKAKDAFPDLIESLEFDRGEPYIYRPAMTDPADGLPPRRQASGLLTGLLQLTAVVGAKPGSILAFDEAENQLHPHAIRSILEAMRALAKERDLTIILTTHSPVLMNEFQGHENRFFLLEGVEGGAVPVALDRARSIEWLSHFALGDLYEREKFSAPMGPGAARATEP